MAEKRKNAGAAEGAEETGPGAAPLPSAQQNVRLGLGLGLEIAVAAAKEDVLDVDQVPVLSEATAVHAQARITGLIPRDFKGLPPFTIKQLRDAIPAHCFERSFFRSFSYVIYDGIALGACYAGMHYLTKTDQWQGLPTVAKAVGWGLWGWVTGVFGTGWWVLAHGM